MWVGLERFGIDLVKFMIRLPRLSDIKIVFYTHLGQRRLNANA